MLHIHDDPGWLVPDQVGLGADRLDLSARQCVPQIEQTLAQTVLRIPLRAASSSGAVLAINTATAIS